MLINPGPSEQASPAAAAAPPRPRTATCQTGTSPIENLAASARAAAVDRGDRVRPRRPGRPGQHRIRCQRPAPPGEHHPDRLDPAGEAPQPAAHRPGRPAQHAAISRCPAPAAFAPSTPPRSPRRCPRGGAATTPAAAHASPRSRCTATAAARSTTAPSGPRTVRARARPHPASTPEHPGHANRPDRSRSSTAAGVGLYREHRASERNHTALPHASGQGHSGRAVAYPDPKIVTVAAPTNPVNTTRPPACDLHAQRRQPSPTSSS